MSGTSNFFFLYEFMAVFFHPVIGEGLLPSFFLSCCNVNIFRIKSNFIDTQIAKRKFREEENFRFSNIVINLDYT